MYKIKYVLIIILISSFSLLKGNYVFWEPEIPVPGGQITIYYNTIDGALPNYTSPVYIHLGYNGWQNTNDYAMTYSPITGNGWWEYTYNIPENAETIDFVFTNLNGSWDNNGGMGIDWHISLNYYWTPFNPNVNDNVSIVINNAFMGGHISWSVDDGNGHVLPVDTYWPENSFEDEGRLMSPLIDIGANFYQVELGPFNSGEQVITSIKFKIKWENGEWDVGSNGQVMYYDIYLDYSFIDGDPYVFFITPTEGQGISGSTSITTVGNAGNVEYWIGGEMIGEANSSPYSVTWTPDPSLFGDVRIIARAEDVDERVSFIFRSVIVLFSIVHEPAPDGTNDGVNISSNNVVIALYAPNKNFISLKGSWNTQFPDGELMKLSGDTLWWYQISLPDGEYHYQYNLEGEKLIADPWSKDVTWVDPGGGWESGDYQHAKTKFSIGTSEFQWTDGSFSRPEQRDLIIYEVHVGDFKGINGQIGTYQYIIQKLNDGYFNDLGVNAIELMPVNEFEGENSWGYNPTFYMAPESTYGTPDELRNLINTAHNHGIAVLHDVVFNHLWGSAPLFQLYQPLGQWDYEDHDYDYCPYFHDQESEWGYKLQHWHEANGKQYRTWKHISDVLNTWVFDYHFDGFRFDHTAGIGWGGNENGASYYANLMDNIDPSIIIIAEEDNSYVVNTTDFDSGWDYSYYHTMKANLMETYDGGHSWGDMYDLGNHIIASAQGYSDYTGPLNYIESHDETRVIYEAIHYQGMSNSTAFKKSKLGATILFTGQGTPMIYHGQEFGQNGTSRDQNNNIIPQPLQWDNLNNENGADLFEDYKNIIALRKHYDVLRSGNLDIKYQSSYNKCIVYWRIGAGEEVIVVANYSNSTKSIDIEFPHEGIWYNFLDGGSITIESNWYGGYQIPASTVIVFLSEIPEFETEEQLIGDVNNDLGIDVLDVVLLVDFIINETMPDGNTFIASDMTGDSSIDVLDVVALVALIMGV